VQNCCKGGRASCLQVGIKLDIDDSVETIKSHSALISEHNAFVTTPRLRQKAALIFILGEGWEAVWPGKDIGKGLCSLHKKVLII